MLKSKLKEELLNIENIIVNHIQGKKLPVYDSGLKYKKLIYEDEKGNDLRVPQQVYYYSALTLDYIKKYLLLNKYSKSMIRYVLIKCVIEKKIKTLICPDIKKVVFHNCGYTSYYYLPNKKTNFNITRLEVYNAYVKNYNSINSYLNK